MKGEKVAVTLDEYQQKALSTALPVTNNIYYRGLGLVSEAGEIADKIKKWIRDQNSEESKLDKSALASELGDVLWYTATLADLLGYSLEQIAEDNVQKLSDRKQRDVIGGRGDIR